MTALVCFIPLVLAAASPPGVEVRGDTECPSAAQLATALDGLVASTSPSARDVAELRGSGGSVSVRLVTSKGEVVAEKLLPAASSCVERARTAAVIVAAWEARLAAGLLGDLSVPRAAPSSAVAPVPSPTAPAAPVVVARAAEAAPASPPVAVGAGVAVLASIVSGEVAPAVLAEVVLSRRDEGFAVGAGVLAVSTHLSPLGPGQAAWRRVGGTFDARWRAQLSRAVVELRAAVALTALSVDGRGLPKPSGATLFDPGALLGLRAKVRLGPVSPWFEGGVAFWPRNHTLVLVGSTAGSTSTVDVPPIEALLGLGVSF